MSENLDLKNAVVEISNSLTRIAAERDQIKSIVDEAKEKHGTAKRLLRKLGKIHYEQSLQELKDETSETIEEYEALFGI